MEFLKAKVKEPRRKEDGSFYYVNDEYVLQVLVDSLPESDSFVYDVYTEMPGYTMYYAENEDGMVRFYAHDPKNETGYGNRTFHLITTEGEVDIKGPWSSRPGQMHSLGFGPCININYTDNPNSFEKGYTFYSGQCSLPTMFKLIQQFNLPYEIWLSHTPGNYGPREEVYQLVPVGCTDFSFSQYF